MRLISAREAENEKASADKSTVGAESTDADA